MEGTSEPTSRRDHRPVVSVVVPTRNEAANVPAVVDRLRAALAGYSIELCFVDDSDDATGLVLEELAERHPGQVRCLLRQGDERTGGLSTAVVAGLRLASGRYVCVMDADLQHPPEVITSMLKAAEAGADLVVASRYVEGGSYAGLDGFFRRLVSRGSSAVARLIFSEARRSTDPLSGFFLCRRELIDGVEFRPVGFKILLELLVLLPADVRVADVPLRFQAREHGASKASAQQGLLYIRHLLSLFTDVKGSARMWKFALVGGSGLAVFLSLLAALDWAFGRRPWVYPHLLSLFPWLTSVDRQLGLQALIAFVPAFAVALTWNTLFNRLLTFADQRRRWGGEVTWRYLRRALISGTLMFATYAALLAASHNVLGAGIVAGLVAMLVNGISNWHLVRRGPEAWAEVAINRGVQSALERLASEVGGGHAYVLPATVGRQSSPTVPNELIRRVVMRRRPVLWTETASHRPQRRTNIEVTSILLLPVVADGQVLAVVVCERRAQRGFDDVALEVATRAVDGLTRPIIEASLKR